MRSAKPIEPAGDGFRCAQPILLAETASREWRGVTSPTDGAAITAPNNAEDPVRGDFSPTTKLPARSCRSLMLPGGAKKAALGCLFHSRSQWLTRSSGRPFRAGVLKKHTPF